MSTTPETDLIGNQRIAACLELPELTDKQHEELCRLLANWAAHSRKLERRLARVNKQLLGMNFYINDLERAQFVHTASK